MKTNRTRYKATFTITAREKDAIDRYINRYWMLRSGDAALAIGVLRQLLANAKKEGKK